MAAAGDERAQLILSRSRLRRSFSGAIAGTGISSIINVVAGLDPATHAMTGTAGRG
jgi:hypothetical protein